MSAVCVGKQHDLYFNLAIKSCLLNKQKHTADIDRDLEFD